MSQYSQEDMIQIARVLVNLGHSYLGNTSVESSEDEGEEEKEKNNQQDSSKINVESLNEVKFADNVKDNIEEKMQVQVDSELKIDYEKQLKFEDECNVSIQQKSDLNNGKQHNSKDSKHQEFDGENALTIKNNKVLTKLSSKRQQKTLHNEETSEETKYIPEPQINLELEHKSNERFTHHFEENQQMDERYIELKLDIEVDPDFDKELNENKPDKYDCSNQLSDEDIIIQLNIEVLDDLDTQKELDSHLIQEEQQNVEEDEVMELSIEREQILENKVPEKFVNRKQPDIEKDVLNTFIEDGKLKKAHKESDINIKRSDEKKFEAIIDPVQSSFDNQLHFSSDNNIFHEKQTIVGNNQQPFDKEILLECNREILEQLDGQKQRLPHEFNKNILISSKHPQEVKTKDKGFEKQLLKIEPQKWKIPKELESEFGYKFNRKVLNYFNNETKNKHKFNIEVQDDPKILQELREQRIGKNQNKSEDETLKMFNKQTFDDQINIHELEEVAVNRIPKEDTERNQMDFSENIQVQNDKELEQVFNNDDTQAKLQSELVSLDPELDAQKKKTDEIVEKIHVNIQQNIHKLTTQLLSSEQNVNASQQNINRETLENSITQIQQEMDKLKMESEEFDYDQDEELEKEIIEKLNKTFSYSEQINFFENLPSLFDQSSSEIRDKIKTLCNEYFQEFDNIAETEFEGVINAETIQKISRILEQEVNEEVNQKLMSETQHGVDKNALQIVEKDIQSTFHGQNERELLLNVDEKYYDENKEKSQEETIEIPQETSEDVFKNFDVVITFNPNIQEDDTETEQTVNRKVQVQFNEEFLKKFQEDTIQNVHENQQQFNEADKQSKYLINDVTNKKIQLKQEFNEETILASKENEQIEFFEYIQDEVDEEKELDLSKETQIDNNKQLQQRLDKEMREKLNQGIYKAVHLELEFFRKTHADVSSQESTIQNEIFIESFKKELLNNSGKISQEFGENTPKNADDSEEEIEELQDKSDVCCDKSKEMSKTLNPITDKAQETFLGGLQEESDVDVEEFEDEDYKNFVDKFKEDVKDKYQFNNSESDVDIESFENETQGNLIGIQNESEEVGVENMIHANFETNEELQLNIDKTLSEKTDEPLFEELKPFKDINEVVELVEEFEIEPSVSVNDRTDVPECSLVTKYSVESSSSEESSSSAESSFSEGSSLNMNLYAVEFSSSESSLVDRFDSTHIELSSEEEKLSSTEELFDSDEGEFNSTKEKCNSTDNEEINDGDIRHFYLDDEEIQGSEFYGESLQEVENEQQKFERQSKLEEIHRQSFEDLQMKMDGLENLDEIPLELQLQQKQFEKNLHKQFKEFQKEFYKDLKREYNNDLQLKVKCGSNPESSQVFDKQQQTFYELKDEFYEMKQEYKSLVQQKVFEELQRNVDDNTLLEVEHFPEQFDDVVNVIDEDIHKEFVELQRECSELEPEFKYNIPLDFEEDNISQSFKPKRFNLFDKLYSIHKRKLCEFVDSKTWPENCLYPSSLLDCLFEDPLEVKPNVLVITLYSIDVGYSIKITMNKNDPPVETFFNYADDSVLSYVEKEELPPHLLEVLDRAEPRLFYNGCVIAEIHDQIDGIPAKLYRILLRPSSMSILSDINQIIAENSHVNWTYERRLKLEQRLLLAYRPMFCTDSSPIAGLAVQLQHRLLSCRTIKLNPLKYKHIPSKLNLCDNILPSESLNESSKSMNVANEREVHQLLWKFDFRFKSLKYIKLYVLAKTDIQEHSMLLCMNSTAESAKIRFKVNLETSELKTYINMILDILKQKVSPDMLVVRRYKNDNNSPDRFVTSAPELFIDKIYDPNLADFNQLIDILLEHDYGYQYYKTDFENKKIESPQEQPSCDLQNTYKTINNLGVNKLMDESTRNNFHFCTSTKLKDNPISCYELSSLNFIKTQPYESKIFKKKSISVESSLTNPISNDSRPTNSVVDPSKLKDSSLDMDMPLHFGIIESSKENLTFPGIKSYTEPTLINPAMDVSLSGDYGNANKLAYIVEKELDSVSATEILLDQIPSFSCPVTSGLIESNPKNVMSSVSTSAVIPLLSSAMTLKTSVSNAITVISPLPSPVTVISSVPSHVQLVSSTAPNVLSTEIFNAECTQSPKHLPILEDSMGIDIKLKPNSMFSKTSNLDDSSTIHSSENENEKHKLFTFYDVTKGTCNTTFLQPSSSQHVDKISVVKHTHRHGICLSGPNNVTINKTMPQIAVMKPKSSVEQITTNYQLDRRKKRVKYDDSLRTDTSSLKRHKHSIEETEESKTTLSSNIDDDDDDDDDDRSVKRKRTTS